MTTGLKACSKCKKKWPLSEFKRKGTESPTKTCFTCREKTYKRVKVVYEKKSEEEWGILRMRRCAHGRALQAIRSKHMDEFYMHEVNASGRIGFNRGTPNLLLYQRAHSMALTRIKKDYPEEFLVLFEEELSKFGINDNEGRVSP